MYCELFGFVLYYNLCDEKTTRRSSFFDSSFLEKSESDGPREKKPLAHTC